MSYINVNLPSVTKEFHEYSFTFMRQLKKNGVSLCTGMSIFSLFIHWKSIILYQKISIFSAYRGAHSNPKLVGSSFVERENSCLVYHLYIQISVNLMLFWMIYQWMMTHLSLMMCHSSARSDKKMMDIMSER